MPSRPRLTPAMADVRRAVRDALDGVFPGLRERVHRDPSCGAPGGWIIPEDAPLVLVALSGGPDSLALAVALGFEQGKCGVRAGAVIVDHGLQAGSAEVAEHAAEQARKAGLSPVLIRRVTVAETGDGPEADARAARYEAFDIIAGETGAALVLLGHTLDDQAETVLLGLARGSGARSLSGMRSVAARNGVTFARPFLALNRAVVNQSLRDQDIDAWHDPHNDDERYARVRVRTKILPMLESEIGPGVAEALARTAAQLADDADYVDAIAREAATKCVNEDGSLAVTAVAALPSALSSRIIRRWLQDAGLTSPTFENVRSVEGVARAAAGGRGRILQTQLPGIIVTRESGRLIAAQGQNP